MRSFVTILILLLITAGCVQSKKRSEPLNVILIVTDDQGYGDLSIHQNDLIETPQLDQLARHSTEFTRFYVSPVCAPTRASLLTGRYHLRTGTSWVTHRKEVMNANETTLAEVFKSNGYRTGLFGKWHNGKQFPHDPLGQGFDRFVGFKDGHLNNYFNPLLTTQSVESRIPGYVSEIFTSEAIKFIDEDTTPFFCYLSFNTPHSPFQVPDTYFDKYKAKGLDDKNAAIYGMVEDIDTQIGRLRDHLEAAELDDRTLILFMTDNGPNGNRYNNGLKGRKGHVDEGGVRVPFLFYHPEKEEWSGRKIKDMAAHIDVLPTLVDLLQLQFPSELKVDGMSLMPILEGREVEDRFFFTHQIAWNFDTIPGAIRSNQYLLTLKENGVALYDLLGDSTQKENLSDRMPQLTEEMVTKYNQWLKDVTKDGLAPPSIEIGHRDIPSVELPAPDAASIAHLEFSGKSGWANDWLIGWSDDARATWKLKALGENHYQVLVELSHPSTEDLKLNLRCGENQLQHALEGEWIATELPSPDRVRRGEVYERDWPLVDIGVMKISPGNHSLVLSAEGSDISHLEVKSIRLQPTDLEINSIQ